jgi:hypothetical protein
MVDDWQSCLCGRTFSQPNAYSNHKCKCSKTKKRLSTALEKAKEKWTGKKRRKLNPPDSESSASTSQPMPGLMRAPSPNASLDLVSNQPISA